MKSISHYVSALVLTCLMAAGFSSCIYDSIPEESKLEQIEDNNITLYIRLGILNSAKSRAEASDIECMSSIRIILLDLDNDGKVEYNNKITYDNPITETGFILIPTVKGKKKLFFIANEESVTLEKNQKELTELIEDYPIQSFGFEEAINEAYFKLDPTKALPMTSEYTLDAGQPGENNYTFYVVPAATKFTFNITNKRIDGISHINKISIDKLAKANYVMPQVKQKYRNWTNDNGTKTSLYWIDWLEKVAKITNLPENEKVPNNSNENQNFGWILDYDLPTYEHETTVMFEGDREIKGVLDKGNQGSIGDMGEQENQNGENEPIEPDEPQYETITLGSYYIPESKNLSNEEQVYTLVLELTDGTDTPQKFSRTLPYIAALFRSTHVVIDITLEQGYMHIYGEIMGWKDNNVYGMLTEEE